MQLAVTQQPLFSPRYSSVFCIDGNDRKAAAVAAAAATRIQHTCCNQAATLPLY